MVEDIFYNMNHILIKLKRLLIVFVVLTSIFACQKVIPNENDIDQVTIEQSGYYTSKEEVSLYIVTYAHLPNNYITKDEAIDLGWVSTEGNLWDVTFKKSIGGDRFYNREGQLPMDENRIYFECDIDYEGGYRNAKRLVYSNDGYIYYTEDHYDTFVLIVEGD
jgi:hypothetical protein